VEVKEGTRIRQSVAVSLFGVTAEPVRKAAATVPGALPKRRNSTEPVIVRVDPALRFPRPAIGLAGAGLVALSGAEAELLRPLRPEHLRADLRLERPGWEETLERAITNASLVGAPLELAVFLPDDPRLVLRALAARASARKPPVATWLLFGSEDAVTDDALVGPAREALAGISPKARFGGGSDAYFAELNRRRPSSRLLDVVAFAVNPQVHAFDDATLVENLAALRWTAETARSFAGRASLALSPVTLRSRVDPRPRSSRGRRAALHRRPAAAHPLRGVDARLPGLGRRGRLREPHLLRAGGSPRRDGRRRGLPRPPRPRRRRRLAGGRRLARAVPAARARAGPRPALGPALARLPRQRDRRAALSNLAS
jgi:hypothetical protein